jgi:hypothetical protein
MRFDYGIPANEIGMIVEVEAHPLETGPTYKVATEFPSYPYRLPYVFWPEYVLVTPTADT